MPQIIGSPGYAAPEIRSNPTRGLDVFSFGVVLLQLVSSLRADLIEDGWIEQALEGGTELNDVIDPTAQWPRATAVELLRLGVACRKGAAMRPKIGRVAAKLQMLLDAEAGCPRASLPTPPPLSLWEVPEHFRCPLSHLIMKEPVLTSDGITFERAEIERSFKKVRLARMLTGRMIAISLDV